MTGKVAPILLSLLLAAAMASPSNYSQLWLSYTPVSTPFAASLDYTTLSCGAGATGPSPPLQRACSELMRGLSSMLQRNFTFGPAGPRGAVVVALLAPASPLPAWPPAPALEAFTITVSADGTTTTVSSASAQGALYGTWRLLSLVQREAPALLVAGIVEASTPSSPLRIWDMWDNLDGSIERGYAGPSLVYPLSHTGPSQQQRYTDFARLLSSVGVNAIMWTNVNACGAGNTALLNTSTLQLLAPLAALFYSFGVHTLLTPCWTSPESVGGLNSSDPRDAHVGAWWSAKVAEATQLLPGAFRGFLFKGDTEGQPGPARYNMSELEGANYFASLLGGVSRDHLCIWRAFSHPPGGRDMPIDQALFQYQRFVSWDGQTLPNLALQTKNGPFDFQVREPVHSLFAALGRTPLIAEFEVTPEYLGQDQHLVAMGWQWSSYFSFNLGGGSTLADVVGMHKFSGVAGVSNFGASSAWTGHLLHAANTYGFARQAWDPRADPRQVAMEWASASLPGSSQAALDTLVGGLLGRSWEAYENYTSSLGWGFSCAGNHYDMDLADRTDYTNATETTIGYSRGVEGGYGATYSGATASDFLNVSLCPEELLLAFHTVPYAHKLRGPRYGNLTVLQWIYASHAGGARTAREFVAGWESLEGQLNLSAYATGGATEADVFAAVAQRLQGGAASAAQFSASIIKYFTDLTGIPPGSL